MLAVGQTQILQKGEWSSGEASFGSAQGRQTDRQKGRAFIADWGADAGVLGMAQVTTLLWTFLLVMILIYIFAIIGIERLGREELRKPE